jgi:hypothetical protein
MALKMKRKGYLTIPAGGGTPTNSPGKELPPFPMKQMFILGK